MTPERHKKLVEIFDRARRLPVAERPAFLAAVCADDDLRLEVERLLANDVEPVAVLDTKSVGHDAEGLTISAPHANTPLDSNHGRFVPGTKLGKRYRIVSLVGRGGMGEVYRADDLELGQAVALKFLPEAVAKDANRLARFRNEVRTARQVSHANVCRVHDWGEIDGQYFLSMEYVDGEDLAGVLRRMGRPSKEKATEIASQICAGLAAAHANGVIHRDLKPANVMIDGRGRVRLTDFGLAGMADQLQDDARAGTPAYMAPEQLSGQGVSVKSDIYSLGLILFEVFTGQRAYEADSMAGIQRLHESGTPTRPSNLVDDIDPVVERIILRCLETDPQRRPSSVLAVAAALPGGDPVAAALAAGETPSPEMVALHGEQGLLRPRTGVVLLVLLAASMVGWFYLSGRVFLTAMVPLPKAPEVLAARAAELARSFGYVEPASDAASGFEVDRDYLEYVMNDARPDRWFAVRSGRPPAVTFWHRRSPAALVPLQQTQWSLQDVSRDNPPLTKPGMVRLLLDPQGRMLEFTAVSRPFSREGQDAGSTRALDWHAMFEAAGLEESQFRDAEPIWRPPVFCDQRRAWTGVLDGDPDLPVRVEAGAASHRATAFRVMWPWDVGGPRDPVPQTDGANEVTFQIVKLAALILAAILVVRNLRLGRGDRQGAARLAMVSFGVLTLAGVMMLLRVGHPGGLFNILYAAAASGLLLSAVTWAVYIAIEPFVRRRWPEPLTGWTRLLGGQWQDPLVGRDILIGATAGVLITVVTGWLPKLTDAVFGFAGRPPTIGEPSMLDGTLATLGRMAYWIPGSVGVTLLALAIVLLFCFIVRKLWLAIGITWLFYTWGGAVGGLNESLGAFLRDGAVAGLFIGCFFFLLFRFGVLAHCVGALCYVLLVRVPGATDLGAWYAAPMWTAFAFITALALFGFYTSLAGRPLLRDELLDA